MPSLAGPGGDGHLLTSAFKRHLEARGLWAGTCHTPRGRARCAVRRGQQIVRGFLAGGGTLNIWKCRVQLSPPGLAHSPGKAVAPQLCPWDRMISVPHDPG